MKKLLSPYSINLYRLCPRKFYFYINEYRALPPLYAEALEFGRVVHNIIRRYYELIPNSIVPGEVRLWVSRAFKEVFPESMEHLRERVENQLITFIRFEERRLSWHINPKPVAIEKEFVKDGVHGIVDALFRRGNELIVVDWKTGKGQADLTDDIIVQLNIYMWLTGAHRAYVLFLEYNNFREVTRRVDVEELVSIIKEDKAFVPRRGPHCSTCEFQIACMGSEHTSFWWKHAL